MTFFVDSPTELTTSATDFILALVAFACLVALRLFSPRSRRSILWQGLFASLGLSSLLGSIVHGIRMGLELNALLWQPLYFFLGLTLTLLATIAIYDLHGEDVARRFLPWLLTLPFVVVVLTWFLGGSFLYFILFEALIMIFVLIVYLYLYAQGTFPGAGLVLSGILLSLVAAVLQASGPFTFRVGVLFDHNGLFHLVQMVGVVFFYFGAKKV